ncbi:MAG: ABC transporter permease subunit [Eubacteriales bacterium]|nr:ABC transporter permease subunit [Eubacteriales bacterium]
MKAFWLELKSICKNFRFLALICILLCMQAMLIVQFQNESAVQHNKIIRANNRYEMANNEWVEFWEGHDRYLQKHGVPRSIYSAEHIEHDLSWYRQEHKLAQEISHAYTAKDWSAYNLGMAKKTLVDWQFHMNFFSHMNEQDLKYFGIDSIPTPENYYGENWVAYNKILSLPDGSQLPWYYDSNRFNMSLDKVIYTTSYYLYLSEKNMPPTSPSDTTSWAYVFNFLRRGLPHVLGIIVLLMSVNLMHRDRIFGSIKTTLQMPKKRGRYLLRKISLGFATSSFIVVIPQLLTFFILGIKSGFKGIDTPVLLTKNFLSLTLSANEIFELRDYPWFSGLGLSRYAVSWLSGRNLMESMEFVPLWQFLLLAVIMLTLFTLFCSVLALLISVVCKNEILAQVVAVGVFILGSSFNRIFPKLKTSPLDLFTKADVVPILEGSHCSTYLSSILALCIAIALLFALSALIFRRQDVQ